MIYIHCVCDVRVLLNLICWLNCSHGDQENILRNVTQGCAGVKAHARPLKVS